MQRKKEKDEQTVRIKTMKNQLLIFEEDTNNLKDNLDSKRDQFDNLKKVYGDVDETTKSLVATDSVMDEDADLKISIIDELADRVYSVKGEFRRSSVTSKRTMISLLD